MDFFVAFASQNACLMGNNRELKESINLKINSQQCGQCGEVYEQFCAYLGHLSFHKNYTFVPTCW